MRAPLAFSEGLELPTSATKTQCPQSFRRPVRDLGCTTPSCLEASLAGCLQRKDSRRPSKARVSLDPVPWESSGGSNAGKHRRGSGRAVQIVPPFRALVQQAPGSSTLAASPAAPRPMTAALRLPFQASVHDESTPRLSVRDMGKCTWQWVADRDLVSYCPSPPASTPHAHAISTPAQPTWTACPIPATKLELPTHTLDSDILWCLKLCSLPYKHCTVITCSSLGILILNIARDDELDRSLGREKGRRPSPE